MDSALRRTIAKLSVLTVLAGFAGCTTVGNFFDPEFLSAIGVNPRAASIPGDAPTVLLAFENEIDRVVEAQVMWRQEETGVASVVFTIRPGQKGTEVVVCPVTEMTIGDVADLDATGAIVRLGNGDPQDPIMEIEAFGVLLREGANYDCGDSITFTVRPSSATRSGYQLFAFVRRASP